MEKDKHYPFLDKETDIIGLEPFDIALIIGIPLGLSIFLFMFLPIGKTLVMFGVFGLIVYMFIYVRKKKHGKERGYVYREFLKKLRNYKKIY